MSAFLDSAGLRLNGVAMRYYADPGFKLGAFTHPDPSVAIVTETGEYGAVIVSGEIHEFEFSALEFSRDCKMVLLQNEMAPDLLPAVAAAARKCGAQVVWNAAPAKDIQIRDLHLADTLIVNAVEAADILARDDMGPDPASVLQGLAQRAPNAEIILTLGRDGVAYCARQGPGEIIAAHAVEVISTHGAGDVFVGTFAANRLRGSSLSQAVVAAQDAAGAHISQRR